MTYTLNGQEFDLTSLISIGDPTPTLFCMCEVELTFLKESRMYLTFSTNENEIERRAEYDKGDTYVWYAKLTDGTEEALPSEDHFPEPIFDKSIFKVRVTDQINILKERWKEVIGEKQIKIYNAIAELTK